MRKFSPQAMKCGSAVKRLTKPNNSLLWVHMKKKSWTWQWMQRRLTIERVWSRKTASFISLLYLTTVFPSGFISYSFKLIPYYKEQTKKIMRKETVSTLSKFRLPNNLKLTLQKPSNKVHSLPPEIHFLWDQTEVTTHPIKAYTK